ncbi:MAG: GTPase HflX [Candidatus Omnitrophica bacterium]|nr:GTPase HflX [Candidatus Omnitrophota bacterium]MCB9720568.1 GTPase HflX [Candidatus Omnitrophota bacterium]
MKNEYLNNQEVPERVLVVVADLKGSRSSWTNEDELAELKELVRASGAQIVGSLSFHIATPSPKNLIGDYKTEEIVQACRETGADTVVFSHELKGNQQRNLEEVIQCKTIDRTQLILDIFARHATSKEGKMQIELAQLEYLLPRLVGKGIELSRLGGGIGTLGPGETKLEVDRRRISDRIARLKKGLQQISQNRQLNRKQRFKKGLPSVSLVGYTNAGKSTLLNQLTQANQKTRDGVFTTLDSLSRQFVLPNHQKIIVSDTVGFMHALPHDLIESFKATLEEVKEADLLMHVVDISHPNFRKLFDAVEDVLEELDVLKKPTLIVFNKTDRLEDRVWLEQFLDNFEHAVCISALNGEGLDALFQEIITMLSAMFVEINVNIPIDRMDLVSLVHEEGEVYSVKYYNDRINIRAAVPSRLSGKFTNLEVK